MHLVRNTNTSKYADINNLNNKTFKDTKSISAHIKEGNVLFNDALNTVFRAGVSLNIHSFTQHILFTLIWCRTYGKEYHFASCYFRLASRFLLYVPSHRQDSSYHDLSYTNCVELAGTRNSSVSPP